MSSDLLIRVIIWLAVVTVSPVVFFFCVPKPFSMVQKVGMFVSILALIAILAFPVVSIAGILNFNFIETMNWITEQRGADEEELFKHFVPLLLAWFICAPLISITLYMSNIAKSVGGLLMIVPPLYLAILGNISNFLERGVLASGSIIYLLCGIILIVLPWIIRKNKEQLEEKKQLRIIASVFMVVVGFGPAICLQVLSGSQDHTQIDDLSEDETIEVETIEANDIEVEDDKTEEPMPSVTEDECFVQGIKHIARYSPHKIASGEYSESIIQQTYQYESKENYIVRAEIHKDRFALTLSSSDDTGYWNLALGELCEAIDINGNTEFFFGQSDIDNDGIDELIVAGRTIQESDNRICVNVYYLRWEDDILVRSIYNKTAYNNLGIAFIEPTDGERFGYIEICEDETWNNKDTWVLQDNFHWIKMDE